MLDISERKLLSAMRHPIELDGRALVVTGSIGLAIFPDDADNGEDLLRFAEPISKVKSDPSFVAALDLSRQAQAITHATGAICGLAKAAVRK